MADFSTLINSHTPTAYWRLNETTGLAADDPAGGHDGIYRNGTVLAEEAGPLNGGGTSAPQFDGVNDYVEAATDASFNLPEGTFQIWMKSDAFGGPPRALASSGSDGNVAGSFFLAMNDGDKGQMVFRLQDGASNKFVFTPLDTVSADQWHHVAVSWGADGMKIYVDGVLHMTNDFTGGVAFTGDPITIGASQMFSLPGQAEPTDRFFKGNLAEAAFIDQALSDGEIADLYNAGVLGDISNIATDDVAATDQDSTVDIDVLDNDSGPATVTAVDTDETAGAVVINLDDTVTYDPNGAFDHLADGETATDTFNYTVKKGGENDLASVTVTVTGVNDAPEAADDQAATEKDAATTITVLANDEDPDSVLDVTSVNTAGTAGSVVVNANNSITYDPNGAFDGLGADASATDTFTYKITDDAGATSTATVTVTVSGDTAGHDGGYLDAVNSHAPVAYWRLGEGAGFTADDIAGNSDGTYRNEMELATVSGPLAGEATVAPHFDGSNDYVEAPADSTFNLPEGTFQIWMKSDTFGGETRALVSSGSDGFVAGSIQVALNSGNSGQISFRLQDDSSNHFVWTPLNTVAADQWHHVVATWGSDGMKIYVDGTLHMTKDFTGGVAFTGDPITIGASQMFSLPGQAEPTDRFFKGNLAEAAFFNEALDADEIDDLYDAGLRASTADLADNDVAAVNENGTVAIDVLDNDHALASVSSVDGAELAGTVTLNGDDTITYDPNGQFEHLAVGETATETFRYSVSDGDGGLDLATATVTIHGENDAPVATKDTARTEKDAQTTLTLVANDEDADGSDVLTVSSIDDSATKGTVTLNADGTVTYNPNGAFDHLGEDEQSADHFSYTVSDGKGGTDTTTVTIAIGKSDAVAATPDALDGLVLWLDAADESTITETGGGVSEWRDKSGNNYHHTQTDAASRPEYVDGLLHGFGGIRLDGTNDFLAGNLDGLSLDGMTLLVVADFKETESFNGILSVYDEDTVHDWNSDNAFVLDSGEVENSVSLRRNNSAEDLVYVQDHGLGGEGPHILVATVGGGVATMEIDGRLMEIDLYEGLGSLDPTNSLIGGRWSFSEIADGKFGENDMFDVLLFDRVLTDDEIDSLYAHLGEKWNVSVEDTAIDYHFVPFAGQSNANRHFTPSDSGEVRFEQELKALTGGTLVDAFNVSTGASSADKIAAPSWGLDRYWWDLEADVPGQLLIDAVQDILDSGLTSNGIVWAQGEQDGTSIAGDAPQQTTIARYKEATEKIFAYFRSELNDPDLQIYIQEIGTDGDADRDAAYDLIRAAQQEMANDIANVHIAAVTKDLERVDNVHFTEEGYKTIAERLASYIAEDQATLPEPVDPPAVEGDGVVNYAPVASPEAVQDLADLESDGAVLNGSAAIGRTGEAVADAGDVNDDGYDDVIIGNALGNEAFVVFGGADGIPSGISLDELDGTNGFRLDGAGKFGSSVHSAGDVNNDGIDDLIIGAPKADPEGRSDAGTSYVVFGDADGFDATVDVTALDGTDGFAINGANAGDNAGFRVDSAGDVNGDGIDDMMIGAYGADNHGDRSGSTYIVYGDADGTDPTFDLNDIDGSNGFRLDGVKELDRAGVALSKAGDINGDGYADVIIGASSAAQGGDANVGESYVVFGGEPGADAVIDLADLDGTNGFRMTGLDAQDWFGRSVSGGGDINGDGFDDFIIGAPGGDPAGKPNGGEAYVVFGKANGFDAALDVSQLDGTNGFRIDAPATGDEAGFRVDFAGDVNGDGFADLLVGAPKANKPGVGDAGAAMVVLGKADGFDAAMTLQGPDGINTFRINGESGNDQAGSSVSAAGDVNGDGYDDFIIGAPKADVDGQADAGKSYVVYGRNYSGNVTIEGDEANNVINGTVGADVVVAGDGNDEVRGNGGADVLRGGAGDDVLAIADGSFQQLVGGNGLDTVRLDGNGMVFDLQTIADNKVTGVEQIDLNGGGNELVLNPVELANLSDETNTLTVLGSNGDALTMDLSGFNASPNGGFTTYTNGILTLLVQNSVSVNGAEAVQGGNVVANPFQDLTDLGTDGAVLNGSATIGRTGDAVADAGDVNGDGYDDVIIGAASGDEAFVVFGSADGIPSGINLDELDGTNGFRLDGAAKFGSSVHSAGDVNNDGIDDLIIGAPKADPEGRSDAGTSYVVFGDADGFDATVDVTALDGTDGFAINGANAGDNAGFRVDSAGDVNGDGIDDMMIGAYGADNHGDRSGSTYIVYGDADGTDPTFDLNDIDGSNGFRLDGVKELDRAGVALSKAGDINGDGYADVIIGASSAAQGGDANVGESYVVFGGEPGADAVIDLADLDGTNGFRMTGLDAQDWFGRSVSGGGDINGDGFDDFIIGAPGGDPAGKPNGGEAYVVFGKANGFDAALDVSQLDGTNGFRIDAPATGDEAGFRVDFAGDVNGDGFADLLVGAPKANKPGVGDAGATMVVLGKADGFDAAMTLQGPDGINTFRINGESGNDQAGSSVSAAGDVNGDGYDDFIIGAPKADVDGQADAGKSYVVYGHDYTGAVTHEGSNTDNVINGTAGADVVIAGDGDDTVNGNGGADVLRGGAGDDVLAISDGAFQQLIGGNGLDTVRLDGNGMVFDLQAIPDNKVTGIEQIDLNGGGNELVLNLVELANLSDETNTLTVLGDNGDALSADLAGFDASADAGFTTYTNGTLTLVVDDDVDQQNVLIA